MPSREGPHVGLLFSLVLPFYLRCPHTRGVFALLTTALKPTRYAFATLSQLRNIDSKRLVKKIMHLGTFDCQMAALHHAGRVCAAACARTPCTHYKIHQTSVFQCATRARARCSACTFPFRHFP